MVLSVRQTEGWSVCGGQLQDSQLSSYLSDIQAQVRAEAAVLEAEVAGTAASAERQLSAELDLLQRFGSISTLVANASQ